LVRPRDRRRPAERRVSIIEIYRTDIIEI
jgi:hypothetical protein